MRLVGLSSADSCGKIWKEVEDLVLWMEQKQTTAARTSKIGLLFVKTQG